MPIFRPPPGTYVGGKQPFAPSADAPVVSQRPAPGPTRNDALFYDNYWRQLDKRPADEFVGGEQPSASSKPVVPGPRPADWSAAAIGDAQWSSTFTQAGVLRKDALLYDNLWQHFQQPPPFIVERTTLATRTIVAADWSAAATGNASWVGQENAAANWSDPGGIGAATWVGTSITTATFVPFSQAAFYAELWRHYDKPTVTFLGGDKPPVLKPLVVAADWSAAAIGAASWVGQESSAAAWTAAATGDAQWVGASTQATAFVPFSRATFYADLWQHFEITVPIQLPASVPFTGTTVSADWSAAATGDAQWVGQETDQSAWTAAATGAATWIGQEPDSAALSAAGLGAATFIGQSLDAAAISAAATATAIFVGNAQLSGSADWTAAGSATAIFVPAALVAAAMSASGIGRATFVSSAVARQNLGGARRRSPYEEMERLARIRKDDEEVLALIKQVVQHVL